MLRGGFEGGSKGFRRGFEGILGFLAVQPAPGTASQAPGFGQRFVLAFDQQEWEHRLYRHRFAMPHVNLHRINVGVWLMILLTGVLTTVPVAGANVPRVAGSDVLLESDKGALRISLLCPSFVFDAGTVGGA